MGRNLVVTFQDLEIRDLNKAKIMAPQRLLDFTMPIGNNSKADGATAITRQVVLHGPPDYVVTVIVNVTEGLKMLREGLGTDVLHAEGSNQPEVYFQQDVLVGNYRARPDELVAVIPEAVAELRS